MSLVFAGVVPHPPLLLPSIGKEHTVELSATHDALVRLEQELYAAKPQQLIIITPHEGLFEDAFVVNAHDTFLSAFDAFGDMTTTHEWHGAPALAALVQQGVRNHTINAQLVSNTMIGHGASIPLTYLTAHLKHIPILPIGYSNLDQKTHIEFGAILKEIIMNADKRIAVVASGDMAHTLSKTAPAGYHADGAWFDQAVQEALQKQDLPALQTLDTARVAHAEERIYRSLLILSGILEGIDFRFESYAYEAPFGVGYLTGQFHLP